MYDGRYLYLVPATPGVAAVRYDSQAPLAQASSWSSFALPKLNGSQNFFCTGAAFDGRFVYVLPANPSSTLARYDTTAGVFGDVSSWSTVDMSTVAPTASSFQGSAFDGQYLYLVPVAAGLAAHDAPAGTVARFNATQPPLMPAGYFGSFF